jgi:prolyl-tRNA editing enzyme YbaK/EbsC (Cys-tRNA(Pro) deacylase)
VKTLVMEDGRRRPSSVSCTATGRSHRELARTLGVKTVQPCDRLRANRHTGYMVGGSIPLRHEEGPSRLRGGVHSLLPAIYINAGRKGLLVVMKRRPREAREARVGQSSQVTKMEVRSFEDMKLGGRIRLRMPKAVQVLNFAVPASAYMQ